MPEAESIPGQPDILPVTNRRELILIRAMYFFYFSGYGLTNVYLNVYLLQAGLNGVQIGAINSAAALAGLISSPLWGILSDRFGLRRFLMIASVIGAGLSSVALAFMDSFAGLLVVAAANTFFVSTVPPLVDAMNLKFLGGDPNRYGMQRLWGTAGYILMTTGMGFVLRNVDLEWVFYAYGILMGVVLLVVLQLPREDIRVGSSFSRRFLDLLRQPAWQVFSVSIFLFAVALNGMHTYLSVYITSLGGSESLVGLSWGLGAVSELLLLLAGARLIRRFGVRRLLPAAFFFLTVRMVLYALMRNPALAVPIGLMHGISFALFWLSAVVYVNEITPENLKTTGQALLTALLSLGSMVTAPLGGAVFDRFGLPWVFAMYAVFSLAAIVVLAAGRRAMRRAA